MDCVLAAPLAELLEFNLPLHHLLVPFGEVVHALAVRALQLDKIILGHKGKLLVTNAELRNYLGLFCLLVKMIEVKMLFNSVASVINS